MQLPVDPEILRKYHPRGRNRINFPPLQGLTMDWHDDCPGMNRYGLRRGNKVARRKSCGFTLIEVLVVMVIMAIIAAIAIPSFLSSLPGYRLRASTRDLLSTMRQARAEAVKRNRPCAIAFNQVVGGTDCSYVLWQDDDADGVRDGSEPIILTANLSRGVTFDPSQGGGDGIGFAADRIVFTSRGLAESAGFVWLRNDRGRVKWVSLTLAGASRIES